MAAARTSISSWHQSGTIPHPDFDPKFAAMVPVWRSIA